MSSSHSKAVELYQPKWVYLKTTSRIYLNSQLETNKSSRLRTRVCQQEGDLVYLTWCWTRSLRPSYCSRRLCVLTTLAVGIWRGSCWFSPTQQVLSFTSCLWGTQCSGLPASVWSLGRSGSTIKTLEPGRISPGESGSGSLSAMHNSCRGESHPEWHHPGSGEPASAAVCTVICMIEFPISREANDTFI